MGETHVGGMFSLGGLLEMFVGALVVGALVVGKRYKDKEAFDAQYIYIVSCTSWTGPYSYTYILSYQRNI